MNMEEEKADKKEEITSEDAAQEFNEEKQKEALEKELNESRDKYLRSLAELENTRKRMQKERQDMTKFALDNLIKEFLEPLDNFEKALSFRDQMSDEVRNWSMGFEMILAQFKDVLAQNGIEAFDAKNEMFDPHLHEAVEVVETSEHKEGTILEVFTKGYKSGDRIVRAAKVKVAKPPKKEAPEEKESQELNNQEEESK